MSIERYTSFERLPILHGQISREHTIAISPNIVHLPHNRIESESHSQKQVIVVSGPPGSGKDSVVTNLLLKSDQFGWPKTVTTRPQRASEIGNDPYIRMSVDEFLHAREAGAFMETDYHGNWYGSPTSELTRIFDEGKTPILRIDPNGAESIVKLAEDRTHPFDDISVLYAYVVPTNGYELYKRLMRRTMSDNGNDFNEALHKTQARIKNDVMPDLTHIGSAEYILINREGQLDTLTEDFLALLNRQTTSQAQP